MNFSPANPHRIAVGVFNRDDFQGVGEAISMPARGRPVRTSLETSFLSGPFMGDASTHQLNAAAIAVLDSIPETDEELGIARLELFGANIIDCGVEVTGSDAAGLLMAGVAMAGLGKVELEAAGSSRLFQEPCGDQHPSPADIWKRPVVSVASVHPVAACLASQYAGWKVSDQGYHGMASGPIRAAIAR
jgi:methenyltetrahydromethanopterin cyclohydrolase